MNSMKTDFRKLYNTLSGSYDQRHSSPTTLEVRKREVPLVRRFAHGRTLDVGCGTGFHLPLVEDVVGMDISEGMLSKASGKLVIQAGGEHIPFRSEAFDCVMCMFSVLNVCDYRRTISEMGRVLKPGGILITSVASVWDQDYETLDEKKGVKLTGDMKTKRFQISGHDTELYLFGKDEITGLFSEAGFELIRFDSVFVLQRPKWGDLTPFSLREKLRLGVERFYPKEYGCIYFMVFRKLHR
jgi:ubiquinone/menaquinone biosynthesis C-methylase UbiE